MSPTLKVAIEPRWSAFDAIRDQTLDFLRQRAVDPDATLAVAMVVGELIENAAKYGVFRHATDTIDLTLTVGHANITIEICNPIGPEETEHASRLDGMIQWIRGFQDPFEAYLGRLKEVSAQSLESSESGLGLVRIAYEGQSVLDFVVKDENVLAVSAVHPLEKSVAVQ